MTRKSHNSGERVAVFAGSFNPFTVGHADIVRRGLEIFDRVVICIGINSAKAQATEAEDRLCTISALYANDPRVTVEEWGGLTGDFALKHGACALLRGVRSVKDYEYERDMADANRRLYGLETVILFADPAHSWISSSLVRELASYGRDITDLLPH